MDCYTEISIKKYVALDNYGASCTGMRHFEKLISV
jgi:hypothetical protein